MPRDNPELISPTAHYTGTVWLQHGLSHPAFATLQGQAFYYALKAPMAAAKLLGGPTLEAFLLARHRLIDLQLERAIESGEISQVIEIAAGLSPRGWRFASRHRNRITYIEADLVDMAKYKHSLLQAGGLNSDQHHVRIINALADTGADSLAEIASKLDPNKGLAIITEGLVNYFDTPTVERMWARFAGVLSGFQHGLYLSDLHIKANNRGPATRTFMSLLSTFVGGRVHLHFKDTGTAEAALAHAGFCQGVLLKPSEFREQLPDCRTSGVDVVRVVCARTVSS
jgi:O-methyltransferase involved in polyketide biosynthesis